MQDNNLYPHWKPDIFIYMVPNTIKYQRVGGMTVDIWNSVKVDHDIGTYSPIIHLTDFWQLDKNLVLINDTTDLNLTLSLSNLRL